MPRNMALVGTKTHQHIYNQEESDLAYWLSRSPIERLQAVTNLVRQTLPVGKRMNRKVANKKTMK
ncbi:hypothetical protein DTQ70_29155 [Runella sp. SP2]|nr:hypothetical protein DTQ70_29155 [Runella sp. SP2]